MGDFIIFLIGVLTCLIFVLIAMIFKKSRTAYGGYELIKYSDENGDEFVNVKLSMLDADESLLKSKRIILVRQDSQK